MLRTRQGLRLLGPSDLPAMLRLAGLDPVVNVFADYRSRLTQLDPRWLGGEVWGYEVDGELVSACHFAANLVPVQATPDALVAFSQQALGQPRRCSTIVGPADQVELLWRLLEQEWSPARDIRWNQPHMEISTTPAVRPDPLVRRSEKADVPTLYPTSSVYIATQAG